MQYPLARIGHPIFDWYDSRRERVPLDRRLVRIARANTVWDGAEGNTLYLEVVTVEWCIIGGV